MNHMINNTDFDIYMRPIHYKLFSYKQYAIVSRYFFISFFDLKNYRCNYIDNI